MKKCNKCDNLKSLNCFHKNKSKKDGVSNWCRSCLVIKNNRYYKINKEKRLNEFRDYYDTHKDAKIATVAKRYYSQAGYVKILFGNIKKRIKYQKSYKNRMLEFSKIEFLKFMNDNKDRYIKLYKAWKDSGFIKKYAPSIDRTNNNKGYLLDNIQIITHGENSRKKNEVDYAKMP